MQSPGFGIAQKLALERKPGPASISRVVDEVMEAEGDRPEDPREHDTVEAQPRGGLDGDRGVDEDVVVEGVAVEGEEDQVSPTGVGGRLRLEDDRDEEPEVLDTPGPGSGAAPRGDRIGQIVPDDLSVGHAVTCQPEEVAPRSCEAGRTRSCSASAIWRASASAASRSRSQARVAARTRAKPSWQQPGQRRRRRRGRSRDPLRGGGKWAAEDSCPRLGLQQPQRPRRPRLRRPLCPHLRHPCLSLGGEVAAALGAPGVAVGGGGWATCAHV